MSGADAPVEGRPVLVLRDDERELLADLLAELLLEALGSAAPAAPRS